MIRMKRNLYNFRQKVDSEINLSGHGKGKSSISQRWPTGGWTPWVYANKRELNCISPKGYIQVFLGLQQGLCQMITVKMLKQ